MKNLFLILLTVIAIQSFGQVSCPPHVPHFDFYFETNVTVGQKVGGVSFCEPDTLQQDTWSIEDSLAIFTINQAGDILVDNAATVIANGTQVYNIIVRITDNGAPPLNSYSTVTLFATKPNEPPVILPQ